MSITVWRILFLASAVIFVLGLGAVFFSRLLKNKYYHSYAPDELMRETKTSNSRNKIYFASGETKKYIKKYVYCDSVYDKFLVCNYVKSFENICYFVLEYSARKRVVAVKQIREFNTGFSSKVIALDRRCKYVNVVICSADGLEINSNVIRPLSVAKIRLHAFLTSLTVFAGLFAVRHLIIEFFGGSHVKFYLNDLLNYIAVGASFILALISYLITLLSLRAKNAKQLNGGALEYEFV